MTADLDVLSTPGERARPVHPKGSRARVLLASVFGPYAQDDEYGSRTINPMELYHNQVTRCEGAFSLRIFHRSWGLMLIQANLEAHCTLLDFPDRERFIRELREHQYDVVGLSGIAPNVLKIREMCRLIRKYQPEATIVVGGHVANVPDLDRRIDADHIVRGEGVGWFRRFLRESPEKPVRHPLITTPVQMRNVGIPVRAKPTDTAMTIIPAVGCPLGCNFCSTSAMFGGKGKFHNFYPTGDELFSIMRQVEEHNGARSFFVMDENILLDRPRAIRLLELMEEHGKAWTFYIFSSANAIRRYSMDELVRLGISWIWLGLEGRNSQYRKLKGVDSFELVRELQANGIRILGSTIIGLEEHTPENIDEAIEYGVRHATDFHQFMLYSPVAGTPLYAEMTAKGLMKDESECPMADAHGQFKFNFRHAHIRAGEETEFLLRAFDRDFAVNGPSVVRAARTLFQGWKLHRHHADPRVRRRFAWEARELPTIYTALAAGAKRHYRRNPAMRAKMDKFLSELHREFGLKSRLYSVLGGPYVHWRLRREQKYLDAGGTYEPPTFYDRNAAVSDNPAAEPCRYVTADCPAEEPAVPPPHAEAPVEEPEPVEVG
jgi:radical SAM superfamily enzyme YgiQ (UPF0313 family)